jgi:RimJ/RimL family protein N-acetyltransferase
MEIEIRDAIPSDAEEIFSLRNDERLIGMQYRPSPLETPNSLFAVCTPGEELRPGWWKCTTILYHDQFAGHITQIVAARRDKGLQLNLGWNLKPELWGRGLMAIALQRLIAERLEKSPDLLFAAFCFASNHRTIRVIEKTGFVPCRPTILERFSNFLKTNGRERLLKYQLNAKQMMQ